MNKEEVYPSIDELLPDVMLAVVPSSLVGDIATRYRELGPKYLTDELTADGRRINACMNKSSIQDAIEEVVDAVFNTLVWVFKETRPKFVDNNYNMIQIEKEPPESAYSCLHGLIEIYGLLVAERSKELARV